MNIIPITNFQTHNSPTFKISGKDVLDKKGQLLYRTTTSCLREDIDWTVLPDLLYRHFIKANKVNVFDYACSTGEEAFTLIISMVHCLGNRADKFFPIIGKDINHENIRYAQSGTIRTNDSEFRKIKEHFGTKINNYLKKYYNLDMIFFNKSVTQKVQFSHGDIIKDIDTLPNINTVLFCRNFLSYLNEGDFETLMTKIANKFRNTNSLLITGNYDSTNYRIKRSLFNNGFACLEGIDNVYHVIE